MKTVKFFVAGFLLIAACSCQASARGSEITEEFHHSYALSHNGSVHLNNVNGGVEVKVWDRDEVKVDAVKHADDKDMMNRVRILVNASSDLVDIDTKYPDDENGRGDHGLWVEYTVTVPRNANLDEMRTVNGDIEISGVSGKLNASTVNGTVRASDVGSDCRLETVNGNVGVNFVKLKPGSDATLKTVNGSIDIDLPDGANAKVKANTVSGHISNDFGWISSLENGEHSFVKVGDSVAGKIGNGDSQIDAESVNGSIRIVKSGEGK